MIKKVVIAAAGQGTRMLHLTKSKSKHLINVLKKPFLAYLLDNVLEAGYKELILVVGYKKEKTEKFLKEYGYEAEVINQFAALGEKEYGTACALKCAREAVGKNNFLMVYGDNLYSVKDLKGFNIEDKYSYVAGFYHQRPEKYGVLKVEDGSLKEIVEKPKKHIGNLINTGLYKFTPEVLDKLSEIQLSVRGEYELPDVINLLAKEKKVKVKEVDFWLDFGNPADIIKASQLFAKWKK
ncbi:MAG: sugar phosphate nucleotidyltransferase [Candidatus Paceibacterales bacterium]